MKQIQKLLEAREKELLHIKKEKEKTLKKKPKDFNGRYIPKQDSLLASRLAQKDYDHKILTASELELNAIKQYFLNCPAKEIEDIYESLHRERQKLVTPIKESDEDYIRRWECIEYEGKKIL